MREKRRAGARPAALAVAVIAALLVPAGTAAADDGRPAEESGVVAEAPVPAEAAAQPAAEPAAQPAAEPAPVEVVAPEAPVVAAGLPDSTPVTDSDDDSVVIEPGPIQPVDVGDSDDSSNSPISDGEDSGSEYGDLTGDVTFTGLAGEWYRPMAIVGSPVTAVEQGFPSGTTVVYTWTVAGMPRGGSTGAYTPSEADLGQQIYVSWTATAPGWNSASGGQRVAWDTLPADRPPAATMRGHLVVSGSTGADGAEQASVGRTLTVAPDAEWPVGAHFAWSWEVAGVERSTTASYTPSPADLGKEIWVYVDVTAPGYQDVSTGVRAAVSVVAAPVVPQGGVTITGRSDNEDITLGTTLKVELDSAWPADKQVTIQWTVAGQDRAVGSSFTPQAADLGSYVQVRVIVTAQDMVTYDQNRWLGTVMTTPKVTVGSSTIVPGRTAEVPVTVAGPKGGPVPTGTVEVTLTPRAGGTPVSLPPLTLDGGSAVATVPGLAIGTYDVKAAYSGQQIIYSRMVSTMASSTAAYLKASGAGTVTVQPAQVGTVLQSPRAATVPGQQMELVAEGFLPGETVAFYLHSDPVYLGSAVADAFGVARLLATVPADAPTGAHTVVATGGTSGRTATLAVELALPTSAAVPVSAPVVTAAPGGLAVTGSQSGALGLAAGLLLAAGGGLVLAARRVRATR